MLLEGLHIPLTTPFHPDGRLNSPKLAANVLRYSRTPAAGLIIFGPSGEPTLLSDNETHIILRAAAQAAMPEKVLIAGISRDSVRSTLALADFAAANEYDAVLVGVPSMLASPETHRPQSVAHLRQFLTYFQTIADRSPLPVVLLGVSGRAIPIDALAELAAHPDIIALLTTLPRARNFDSFERLTNLTVKRRDVTVTPIFSAVTGRMKKSRAGNSLVSTASLTNTTAAIAEPSTPAFRTRTKSVGFQILTGDTVGMLDALHAGAVGVAPAFAGAAPQACYEVFAAWKDDDQPLAAEKQARLLEVAHLAEATPGALKFAADLNGYFGGQPRLPHLPLSGAQRTELEQQMKPLRS
jgi:4-hydroxy-2-oxoglutarate aldolase